MADFTEDGGTTYGAKTNVEILALPTPIAFQTAYSTDNMATYTFDGAVWRNEQGGEIQITNPMLVGQVLEYPDGSKQVTAGVQPVDGRSFFVSEGGLDTNAGTTLELPRLTIGSAVTTAALTASVSLPIVVQISKGTYDEQVAAVAFVDIEGMGASILNTTTSVTALKGADSQQNQLGFVGSFAATSIVYDIDGIQRNLLNATTMTMGSPSVQTAGITGVRIKGTNDDIQVRALSVNNNSNQATMVDITGTSVTPITISLGNVTNFADDFTGINCNSSDALQIVNVNFDNFTNGNGTPPTDVVFCTGTSGLIILRGANAVMPGEMFVSVGNGLSCDISMSQVQGNIECLSGGNLSFSKFGLLLGNIDMKTGSNVFGGIDRVAGDVTIESGASYDGIIGKVTGTVTIDPTATVDGIINGVRYGTYSTYFAHFFVEANVAVTTINIVNVYEDINCSLTGDMLNGFTVSGNTMTYINPEPINVEIAWQVTGADIVDQKDEVLIKAHKNGNIALTGRGRAKSSPPTPASQALALSVFQVTGLVQGDTIDLKTANATDDSDIIFLEITGTIRQIK